MKNVVKTILFTTVILAFTSSFAYASEHQGNTNDGAFTSETKVCYTVDGSYTIDIPECIVVGGSVSIIAKEIDIAEDQEINVTLESIDDNNLVVLTNEINPNYTLGVEFGDAYGNTFTKDNNVVATFGSDDAGEEFSLFSYPDILDGTKPGDYSGRIAFKIECN